MAYNLKFTKYQGAGNDFIIINESDESVLSGLEKIENVVSFLCNRRFGIGADGLMLLQPSDNYDFRMVYFNSDGRESTMCGNGGRCLAAYASQMGIIKDDSHFIAIDGEHHAIVNRLKGNEYDVSLQMIDVEQITEMLNGYFLDTGSPHLVVFKDQIETLDVFAQGKMLRNHDALKPGGANVNFAEIKDSVIFIRTFERGVEDETLACGTGITATAIAACYSGKLPEKDLYEIKAMGGNLGVSFRKNPAGGYSNVYLHGPATYVFDGEISITHLV